MGASRSGGREPAQALGTRDDQELPQTTALRIGTVRTILHHLNGQWVGLCTFELFGHNHLLGEKGILNLLQKDGFTVEQMDRE